MSKEIMSKDISAVQKHQGRNKDLTINLITDIITVFETHPLATPAMVTAGYEGKDSKAFVGRARGAWLCHKSGIAAGDISVMFIANNYDQIKVMSSAKEQADEIKRVFKEISGTRKALNASNNASGKAFNDNMVEASNAVVLVKNTHTVWSPQAQANFDLLKAQVASLGAQLDVAKRIEEESLSKVG
jgi:hypothetical protein